MSKKDEVYVVTSGEYSDYGIEAVYLSRATANRHAKKSKYARVEVWPIRHEAPKKVSELTMVYHKEGDFPSHYYGTTQVTTYHQDEDWDEHLWDQWCWPEEVNKVRVDERPEFIRVAGFNHEKVRKVMGDRVARYKAEEAGIA